MTKVNAVDTVLHSLGGGILAEFLCFMAITTDNFELECVLGIR